MPPLPGEERMLTVFADIHSYFEEPSPKPIHHRFDKGSYLYVYHDATQHKSRIEVANNPGSPDQDAFNGALDRIHLCHSTRFPTLCTLTVDGPDPNPQAFPPPPNAASLYEWRLPSNDPRDEQGDLLRLHTLDIYFWLMDDANEFLNLMEHLLSQSQIESDRHALPLQPENGTDNNNVSSVVQQLENVAVTDPAYQNAQTPHPNRTPEKGTVIPPPPPAASTAAPAAPVAPAVAQGPSPTQQTPPIPQPAAQEQPAPLPYNPAAPAAPEPIQHREKTPPPADGADGTGIAAAVAADNGMPYIPPSQTPGGSFAPPPSLPTTQRQGQVLNYPIPGTYASPPPSAGLPPSSAPGLTHSGSLSSRSSSIQGPPPGVMSAYAPSPSSPFFPGNPQQQQPLNRTGSISFAPPPQPQPQDPAFNPNLYLYQQQQQQLQQQQQQQHQYKHQQLAQQQPQQQLPQQYLYGLQGQPQPQSQLQPQLFHPHLQQQLPQQPTTATLTPAVGSYPSATPTTTTIPFTNEYDLKNLHNQAQTQALYRSAEAEQKLTLQKQQQQQQQQQQVAATNGAGARGGGAAAGEAPRGGKLENRAAKVESGVNRFLKKLEKRL